MRPHCPSKSNNVCQAYVPKWSSKRPGRKLLGLYRTGTPESQDSSPDYTTSFGTSARTSDDDVSKRAILDDVKLTRELRWTRSIG